MIQIQNNLSISRCYFNQIWKNYLLIKSEKSTIYRIQGLTSICGKLLFCVQYCSKERKKKRTGREGERRERGTGEEGEGRESHLPYCFDRAAITKKKHRLGGLNSRNLFSHSLGTAAQNQGSCRVGFSHLLPPWLTDDDCLSTIPTLVYSSTSLIL